MITRRTLLTLLGGSSLAAAGLMATASRAAVGSVALHVMSSPSCGCCHAWADLARLHGYAVSVEGLTDPDAQKAARGVPADLVSCHTVEGEGYIFEGHVPFGAV